MCTVVHLFICVSTWANSWVDLQHINLYCALLLHDAECNCMMLCDTEWQQATVNDTVTDVMPSDSMWQNDTVTMSDSMWQWVTACDSEWQHVTVNDTVTMSDSMWQWVTARDGEWYCDIEWHLVTACDGEWYCDTERQHVTVNDTVTVSDSMWQNDTVTACDTERQHVMVNDTVTVSDSMWQNDTVTDVTVTDSTWQWMIPVTDVTRVRRLTISTCLSNVTTAVATIISVVWILRCCECQRRPNYRAGLSSLLSLTLHVSTVFCSTRTQYWSVVSLCCSVS